MLDTKIDISTFVDVRTQEKVLSDLVARFKRRRKELHYSQSYLADLSNVSLGSLRRFEQTGEISFTSLLRLAQSMNLVTDFDLLFRQPTITNLNGEKWND